MYTAGTGTSFTVHDKSKYSFHTRCIVACNKRKYLPRSTRDTALKAEIERSAEYTIKSKIIQTNSRKP